VKKHGGRRIRARAWSQACVIALLINLLIFPPALPAQGQVSKSWNGGPGNWTDFNWICTNNCSGEVIPYPDNNVIPGYDFLASIATGNDDVTLQPPIPISVDGLTLGSGSGSSVLTIHGDDQLHEPASLTIGGSYTAVSGSLTINGGGTLNVQNFGTLNLQDLTPGGGNTTAITNNGAITFSGSGNLQLNDGGAGNTFLLQSSGSGVLVLSDQAQIFGINGSESLINDTGHTINVGIDQFNAPTGATNAAVTGLNLFGNNGNINIGGVFQTPAQSPGATHDGPPVSTLTIETGFSNSGTVFTADGNELQLLSLSGETAAFNNDGNITLGQSSGATLQLFDGGSGTTFDLKSNNFTGTLTLNAASNIQGAIGTESLISDGGHTINVNGFGEIDNLKYFENDGTINIGTSFGLNQQPLAHDGGAFVPPTPSASLTIDTSAASGALGFSNAYNTGQGTINVADGAALILQNTSGVSTALLNNDGQINLGNLSGGYLALNSGGAATAFDLGSGNFGGVVNLFGNAMIYGVSGNESLINDAGHVIAGSGTITNLASFTNNGTLLAIASYGGPLTVTPTLTNWDAASQTMNGGTYGAEGTTLQLTSLGSGTILNLINGGLVLAAGGLITGDGATDAVSTVTNAVNSEIYFLGTGTQQSPYQISPAGGTLSLTASATAPGFPDSSLRVEGGSNVQIGNNASGSILNQAITSNGTFADADVEVDNSSSLSLAGFTNSTNNAFASASVEVCATFGCYSAVEPGSTLNVSGNFIQSGTGLNSLYVEQGSTATVGGLTNSTGAFDPGKSYVSPYSQVSVMSASNQGQPTQPGTGSTLNITGYNGFTNISASGMLTGGQYQIGANSVLNYNGSTNITGIGADTVLILDNEGGFDANEDLTQTGTITNNGVDAISNSLAVNNGVLTLQNGASLTLTPVSGSFTNNGFLNLLGPDDGSAGSTLDLSNTNFTNVSGDGVLSGGSYNIAGDSELIYSGADINKIAANTSLTLDGVESFVLNANNGLHDGVGNTLTEVDGTLRLLNGASMALGTFNNITSNAASQGGLHSSFGLSGGTLQFGIIEVGDGSSLSYNGPDITTIAAPASLTLDGNWNLVSSSGNPDALSNSLTTVYGALAVNNAGNLDLSQPFTNVTGDGHLQYGNITVDGGALSYFGSQINTIDSGASLTLGYGNAGECRYNNCTWGLQAISGNEGTDAISSSLSTVNGTLAVVDGASLTLTGDQGSFTVGSNGTLNIGVGQSSFYNGSTVDISAVNFTNISNGTLSGGNYLIGTDSLLAYNGENNITAIGANTSLTFDNDWLGSTGAIQNNNSDALSNSLARNDGTLNLQNYASLNLGSGSFTNGVTGTVTLTNQSSLGITGVYTNLGVTNLNGGGNILTAQGFANGGTLNVGAGDTADFRGGDFVSLTVFGQLSGGTYNIGGTMIYDGPAITSIGAVSAPAERPGFGLSQPAQVTLDAANGGAAQILTSDGSNALANLTVIQTESSLTLSNGASLSVTPEGGTFTNEGTLTTGGTGGNTFNVTGDVFNTSPGVVNLSATGDQMNITGSFTNDGTVTIAAGATLSVDDGAGTFLLESGDLSGGGELDADLVQTGGTFNPGGDPQSFDVTGNYTLDAGAVLDFDLAGLGTGQYDQVVVGGSASIDPNAVLQVTLDNGFTPLAGERFTDIFSWGLGATPTLLSFNNQALGLLFSMVLDPNNSHEADLLVSSQTSSATPEPGTLWLLLSAMLIGGGITWKVRHARKNWIK